MEYVPEDIKAAYDNWQRSIVVFNNAVTKEEIDFAILNMEAKRKHYYYLLGKAKDEYAVFDDFNKKNK